jgi:hypothetical protein
METAVASYHEPALAFLTAWATGAYEPSKTDKAVVGENEASNVKQESMADV